MPTTRVTLSTPLGSFHTFSRICETSCAYFSRPCATATVFVYLYPLLHSNELTKQPAHATFARGLLDAVFAPPSNKGCPCVTLAANLRSVFKAYGEGGISMRDNQSWGAVSVAMIYFILTTDLHFAAPMSAPMKANHLTQLRVLNFPGPEFPAQLLQ